MYYPQANHYILPPRKSIKWNSLCNVFILFLFLHLGAFAIAGNLLPGASSLKMAMFDVSLVKELPIDKGAKIKAKSGGKGKTEYYSKRNSSKPPGPDRKNNLHPGPKKPNPPSDAKPPDGQNAAPNLPLAMELPETAIKNRNDNSNYPVYKKPDNQHKDGAPSGQPDGILGSQGTDGDIYGKGGGQGIKAGGGGGGGSGGGSYRSTTLQLCWETNTTLPFRYTGELARQAYFKSPTVPAYLVIGRGPANQSDQEKAGTGYMEFELTIPASENVPETGLHAEKIVFIEGKADDPAQFELMKRLATESVEDSTWYPTKIDGKPVAKPFRLKLHFMGVVDRR